MKSFVLLAVLALSVWSCSASKAGTAAVEVDKTNQSSKTIDLPTAPPFELAKVDGGTMSSADLKGKVVVVDFWATWCVDCIKEIPSYNDLYEKYKDKGVQFVGITVESGTLEDIKPKVAEFKMKYPVLIGTEQLYQDFGNSMGFPMTYVVTQNGKIHHGYLGVTPNKKKPWTRKSTICWRKGPWLNKAFRRILQRKANRKEQKLRKELAKQ